MRTARWLVQGKHLYRPSAGRLVENRPNGDQIVRKFASPSHRLESPRGDFKRELVKDLAGRGAQLSGRQRRKLRKALARGGEV